MELNGACFFVLFCFFGFFWREEAQYMMYNIIAWYIYVKKTLYSVTPCQLAIGANSQLPSTLNYQASVHNSIT